MNKLALAAIITASIGGVGVLVFTAARSSDAHAQSAIRPQEPPTTAANKASPSCGLEALREHLASSRSSTSAAPAPTLAGVLGGLTATAHASNDCAAVARHLAELEGDATHGPDHRPDEATCNACASHYKGACESEGWSEDRRNCTLAAADLINAHLCAGGVPRAAQDLPPSMPPSLTCKPLGQHIGTIAQAAGFHADVADLPLQIEAACETGSWSLELRQCFAAATTLSALEACIVPPAE